MGKQSALHVLPKITDDQVKSFSKLYSIYTPNVEKSWMKTIQLSPLAGLPLIANDLHLTKSKTKVGADFQ